MLVSHVVIFKVEEVQEVVRVDLVSLDLLELSLGVGVSDGFLDHLVEVETVAYSGIKDGLGIVCEILVSLLFDGHDLGIMVDLSHQHFVSNSL